MNLYGDLDMAKVMMGQNAFHIPINLIAQPMDQGRIIGVFQTSNGVPLLANSNKTHVLLLGDMIFRPRVIAASNAFQGCGVSALLKQGFSEIETWLKGDVILAET